jgi:hypothetical protein
MKGGEITVLKMDFFELWRCLLRLGAECIIVNAKQMFAISEVDDLKKYFVENLIHCFYSRSFFGYHGTFY